MVDTRKIITKEFFGMEYRFIDIMKSNEKEDDEIFFCIERRKVLGPEHYTDKCGYLKKTPEMRKFIAEKLFTGCSGISFIQWPNCWNVVFEEKSIIGNISFKMENEEFNKLFN
ncbi:hypothetical protein SAMN05216537_11915 [Lachnospira multipara]|uniref:Uncharacterized protein n=2 Tax=Lachnospira multipara TaxID=28051 RepID=A0A1H5WWU6_9FIRM|nr:hypothetical protein SAMN05216537_11915 [Lachnospira multipara]